MQQFMYKQTISFEHESESDSSQVLWQLLDEVHTIIRKVKKSVVISTVDFDEFEITAGHSGSAQVARG
jgi:hypothetical protein